MTNDKGQETNDKLQITNNLGSAENRLNASHFNEFRISNFESQIPNRDSNTTPP
jgi:hypothetical protein